MRRFFWCVLFISVLVSDIYAQDKETNSSKQQTKTNTKDLSTKSKVDEKKLAKFIEKKTIESQPEILFKHKKLQKLQDKREILLKFNTAVLYLEQEKYMYAITLFKQTSKLLKIPSYLNIGIAYYKLKSYKNAYLYLKNLYNLKGLKYNNKYAYFSAAYYLYKITSNEKYIKEITSVAANSAQRLTEQEKLLVVDTLILQKKYDYALELSKNLKHISKIKQALLALKLRDYTKARMYLEKAFAISQGDDEQNNILWFKLYRDIKANSLDEIIDSINKIKERKVFFHSNTNLVLELYFNKNKFTPKEYLDKITNFSYDTKLDMVYYFAPFIFEDYDAMGVDETKSFILQDKNSIYELNTMIKYNAQFLKVIKLDPIKRVQILQKMIDEKYDTKAYEYYNLGLSYAQIYDYINAYKYFKKAYNLDHGNKLYAVMTYLTTKKFNIIEDKTFMEILLQNISSSKGSYVYLAHYMFKVFEDPSIKLDKRMLSTKQERSIFFRALYFLDHVNKTGIVNTEPLLVEFSKDPLVYLLNMIAKKKDENLYTYVSRLQDEIPKVYNNNFLYGNLIITDFYLDTLRALGLFNRTKFDIPNNVQPSYLRTKAIVNLYRDNPQETIRLISFIKKEYELKSIDSFYILIGALLSSGNKELAYATLTEIEILYKDKDARFLSGIRLIQDMKLNSAVEYFRDKLKGGFIDIRLRNFDKFLESL